MQNLIDIVEREIKEQNITKKKLAELTGYSATHISDLLRNNRRWNEDVIEKVCDALKIQIEYKITKENTTDHDLLEKNIDFDLK